MKQILNNEKSFIRLFLESQNFWDVVKHRNYEKEYSKEEFKKRNKEALSYIFQAVELSLIEKISRTKKAREVWRMLTKFRRRLIRRE